MSSIPLETRFWNKVAIGLPNECWEWQACKKPSGYGDFGYIGKKRIGAHRMSYILANGSIPDGMDILHKCDNPPCCNPNHLFAGTAKDNSADMTNKGRSPTGDRNGSRTQPEKVLRGEQRSKLKTEQVYQIFDMKASGKYTQAEIARYLGIRQMTVSLIVNRKLWKHIDPNNLLSTNQGDYSGTDR